MYILLDATLSTSASVSSGYIGKVSNDRVSIVLVDIRSGFTMSSAIGNSESAVFIMYFTIYVFSLLTMYINHHVRHLRRQQTLNQHESQSLHLNI
jgi:hypothetical protein